MNLYINESFATQHDLRFKSAKFTANVANSPLKMKICGVCYLSLTFVGNSYKNFKFYVMSNSVADAIIGDDLLQRHKSVIFKFEGNLPKLCISSVMPVAHVLYPQLFSSTTPNSKPIAAKTPKIFSADQENIKSETERLLYEDLIEPRNSPWRAQPLVVDNGKGKKRMCIDYSQTVNVYTQLVVYHLSSIESIANEVAKWKDISTLNLKSAYHRIQIRPEDRLHTAFQSGLELYQ